ncbi:RluA family pseudouridine synthase [Lentibacter sp.]|uniref:RluA family pseudouridine synthase n=1 Tax=Lentibacter sp. TaxID=2024994 RepID=UPI003F6BF7B4
MSGVQHITVLADDADQRLDRFLKRRFPLLKQGQIEKMCRKGDLRVDGGRVKTSTRVEEGQTVRIPPLPSGPAPEYEKTGKVSEADAKLIRSCVIYRDDQMIVLNKPAGLPTQGGSKQTRHVDGLSEALKFDYDEKPRLVHRLDKDTSGILVLARTRLAAKALTEAFRHRETRKIYWAAVAGVPNPRMGIIKWGLVKAGGHGASGEGEKMICVHPREVAKTEGAKRAQTDFMVMENVGQRCAWVAMVPITGRTHQLRAHMAELGHPIVGDGKYGGSSQENLGDGWGAQLGGDISKKLHLHARYLRVMHPETKQVMEFKAALPDHMNKTWQTFQWEESDTLSDPTEEMS